MGYRQAQMTAVAAATTVSLFLGFINPVLGLVGIMILFFSFRALFRHRTNVILRKAGPQIEWPESTQTALRYYCKNCNLWNDESACKQCGSKLVQ